VGTSGKRVPKGASGPLSGLWKGGISEEKVKKEFRTEMEEGTKTAKDLFITKEIKNDNERGVTPVWGDLRQSETCGGRD